MQPSPAGLWIGVALFAQAALVAAPATALEYIGAEVAVAPTGLENIGAGPAIEVASAEVAEPEVADSEVADPEVTAKTEVTPANDAYHYPAFRDGRHDALYIERWYFNLHDPREGVPDSEDIGGLAMVQMVAVTAIDRHPAAAFEADGEEADVRIGDNRARVGGDGVYRVSGASLDGRMAWELEYVADSAPWFAADRMAVGRLRMPRARVTGTLTLDGRSIALPATGYHDHNRGEWIPTDATWNWAQFSSPRLSLEVGDFIGKPVGVVALDLDGTRTG